MNGVAYMKAYGVGDVELDPVEAFRLFLEASSLSSATGDALYNVGAAYALGLGTPVDLGKSHQYMQLASQKSNLFGMHALARQYALGYGAVRSCENALSLYKAVAERSQLGLDSLSRAFSAYDDGDYATSLREYVSLAEMGYEVAQANAANLLERGYGEVRDDGKKNVENEENDAVASREPSGGGYGWRSLFGLFPPDPPGTLRRPQTPNYPPAPRAIGTSRQRRLETSRRRPFVCERSVGGGRARVQGGTQAEGRVRDVLVGARLRSWTRSRTGAFFSYFEFFSFLTRARDAGFSHGQAILRRECCDGSLGLGARPPRPRVPPRARPRSLAQERPFQRSFRGRRLGDGVAWRDGGRGGRRDGGRRRRLGGRRVGEISRSSTTALKFRLRFRKKEKERTHVHKRCRRRHRPSITRSGDC